MNGSGSGGAATAPGKVRPSRPSQGKTLPDRSVEISWGRSSPHLLLAGKGGAAMNDDQYFPFEKLHVYQVAKEVLVMAVRNRARFRGLPGELPSQLDRALLSVVANITEATGRQSLADRKRHFAIARGSATEAGGLVEMAVLFGALDEETHQAMRSRLIRVAQMLTGLIR
ncbi:MAG: four helix bundle protein [Myxococcales bacterium]|nr:four helix bundle protein [Myxococcales bacterium]